MRLTASSILVQFCLKLCLSVLSPLQLVDLIVELSDVLLSPLFVLLQVVDNLSVVSLSVSELAVFLYQFDYLLGLL